ncbi:hypothetical protein KAH81_05210 [bacterium]|nr:hypothetical protein [bacterium]
MSVELKEEAKSLIDQLDDIYVREMMDFMLWLKDRKEWEATYEIMSITGAESKFREGLSALDKGDKILLTQFENE